MCRSQDRDGAMKSQLTSSMNTQVGPRPVPGSCGRDGEGEGGEESVKWWVSRAPPPSEQIGFYPIYARDSFLKLCIIQD